MKTPPVLAQHQSWISLDPIIGCPGSCGYCYLEPLALTRKRPVERIAPTAIYQQLLDYRLHEKRDLTGCERAFPIAVGNHTDMCLTSKNREYLLELARVHVLLLGRVPLCVITKAALDDGFLVKLKDTGANIIVLVSLSFLPPEFERGLPHWRERLRNFTALSAHGIRSIHWWRPLTRIATPNVETAMDQFAAVCGAGASCVVGYGLGYSNEMARRFSEPSHSMHSAYSEATVSNPNRGWSFERMWGSIAEAAGGGSCPTFRSTGCAVSFLEGEPCITARFRRIYRRTSCIFDNSFSNQARICRSLEQKIPEPGHDLLNHVAAFLDVPRDVVAFDALAEAITVDRRVSQEDQMHLTQVTSFPIIAAELDDTLAWRGDTPTIGDLTR